MGGGGRIRGVSFDRMLRFDPGFKGNIQLSLLAHFDSTTIYSIYIVLFFVLFFAIIGTICCGGCICAF